ncbi:MAG: hypothetical protein DIZ78_09340 [endosymbiont of Escarpia spicata]|uniref:Uncharacterized protein n=1 Tax=endosymbiont of Escarpia spicata TaxID=2200908 RepID=A0A370DNF3_9GAMM|nr:MAG: hypothetical protein DIZ78_09340 [endosymbiont of Escarpia spicata]
MTAYNAIPAADIDPDSPLTTSLMTHLRDNPIAISEGSTGAPKNQTASYAAGSVDAAAIAADAVGQSEIAANAVGSGELKTATASQSVSVPSLGTADIVLTGGDQTMGYFYGGSTLWADITSIAHDQTYAARARFYNSNSSFARTVYVHSRYVQASPPYDLGDGECGLFIYVQIAANGDILGLSEAADPIWAHNGPTNALADSYDKDGIGYRHVRKLPPDAGRLSVAMAAVREKTAAGQALTALEVSALSRYTAAFKAAPMVRERITNEMKNADMNVIPSPYQQQGGTTIVMLDPVSDLSHELLHLKEHQGVNVSELFELGALEISSTELNRAGPTGMPIVDFGWKNAGAAAI